MANQIATLCVVAVCVGAGCGDVSGAADAASGIAVCTEPALDLISSSAAPGRDSMGYVVLSADDRADVALGFAHLIAGDVIMAADAFSDVGYQLCRGAGAESDLVVVRPMAPAGGGAAVVFRTSGARPLVIGAPHPVFETHTLAEAKQLFGQIGARALIVSGTHRCANAEASTCSGTSGVCGMSGEPYRTSDMAHVDNSSFHEAHKALVAAFPNDWTISLHGMSSAGVSLSNGTTNSILATDPVALLAAELTTRLPGENITTCNSYVGANVDIRLCGTTNVQGRLVNESAAACTAAATTAVERFVHMEQSLVVRESRQQVIDALDAVVP